MTAPGDIMQFLPRILLVITAPSPIVVRDPITAFLTCADAKLIPLSCQMVPLLEND
jgi:hypothetical protein